MSVPNLTEQATSATVWSALEIASRYGVTFVVTIILARLLSPTDFGLIAMLLVFTSIGASLANGGFGTALIQRQHSSPDDETTVFVFTMIASLFVATVLWFSASLIASFYTQPLLLPLTRFMAITLPINALAAVPDALLTKKLNFKARARAEIVASLLSGAIAVGLAWRGYGVWSLAWQVLAASSLRTFLLWLNSAWKPRGRFRKDSFRGLFGFGAYMLLSDLLDTIYLRIQSILIGKLYDSRALGYYTLAQNTQQAPASLMGGILSRVGLPVFSSVSDRHGKLLGALRLSQRIAMFLFVPCMFGIALIAKPLIVMVFGIKWLPAAPILSILAVSSSFWPMHVLNFAAISAQGRSNLVFRLATIQKLTGIGLVVISAAGGPIMIAWATLAATLFSVCITTYYVNKLLRYGILSQVQDQLGTFVLSIAAAFTGWCVLHFMVASVTNTVLSIFSAVVVYILGAFATQHLALKEFLVLVRSLRVRRNSVP
jgi:teichuronic acid exporter